MVALAELEKNNKSFTRLMYKRMKKQENQNKE